MSEYSVENTSSIIIESSTSAVLSNETKNCSIPVVLSNCDHDFWREMYFICVGMIIPIGLIFNTLALLVFVSSWLRRTIPGRYFITLAIADNLVLLGELLKWLNTKTSMEPRLGFTFMHHNDVMCKGIYWLRYGARMWSSWITVTITIERFLTVTFPIRMATFSNPVKSILIVSFEFLVCFSASTFTFFTTVAKPYQCRMLCQMNNEVISYNISVLTIVGLCGELVIPSIMVFIFTVLIVEQLARAARRKKNLTEGQNSISRLRMPRNRERQPTIALLSIAVMFLTVRLPYMITFMLQNLAPYVKIPDDMKCPLYIAYKIGDVLAVTNYAFNFLLFCISGVTFRNELTRFVQCRCSVQNPFTQEYSRSRSMSMENPFQVVVTAGRSASVDILSQIGRKFSPFASKATSTEHLQNSYVHSIRSSSVGAEKLLNCNSSDLKLNQLRRNEFLKKMSDSKLNNPDLLGKNLKESGSTRSLQPQDLGLNGEITFIDDP